MVHNPYIYVMHTTGTCTREMWEYPIETWEYPIETWVITGGVLGMARC